MPFEDLRESKRTRGCIICGEETEAYPTLMIREKGSGNTIVTKSTSMCEKHTREWWDRALATFDAP